MPQVIAMWAVAAVSYVSLNVAVLYGVYAVAYVASIALINRAIASLGPNAPRGDGRGLEVSSVGTDTEGAAIYGMVRVGGVHMVPPITGNADGRYLEQVLTFCVHEVDSFTDVYFDDTKILNADIGSITGASTDGVVSGSTEFASKAWIRRYTGTTTQTVDFILNNRYSTVFTSDFRGRGWAYVATTFDWGDGKTYRGVPLVTCVIKGKKCYDPRLDVTPGASPTNASYIAWTSNPALCWSDYAMADYGGRAPSTYIDWASVVTAADVCDVLVNIPGATTQKRYTFNGRLGLARPWGDNSRLFIDAMLGRTVYRDGKWFIYAGAWDAAAATIEKTDWLALDNIRTVAPRDGGRWNTVRCWYVDPDRNWQRVECFARRNATYKSADGAEEIAVEMEQPACTSEYEAQRKAEFLLRQSRNQIAISGHLPPRFHKLVTGDVVALNFEEFGWVSKLMRVRSMNINQDASVSVGLVEEQEADWTDLAAGEYNAPSSSTVPTTNPTTPSEATLSLSHSVNGTIRFVMADPVVQPIGTRFQIIQSLVSTNASAGTVVYDGLTQVIDLPSQPLPFYFFSRAYVNSHYGPYSPNTLGLFSAGAYTSKVTQVNCTATQVFSSTLAIKAPELGRVDFAPSSSDAVVSVTAGYRTGLQNINDFQNIRLRFATGVTSSYFGDSSIPIGGTTTNMQPVTQTAVFTYTKNNSSYVQLYWDVASGANSFTLDQVSLRTEFIRL